MRKKTIIALLLALTVTAPVIAQRTADDDDVAIAVAIALANFSNKDKTKTQEGHPSQLKYTDAVTKAVAENVPLVIYVNCGEVTGTIAGSAKGTIFVEVEKMRGFPERCVVVAFPDGKGWIEWEKIFSHLAPNEQIRDVTLRFSSPAPTEGRREEIPLTISLLRVSR